MGRIWVGEKREKGSGGRCPVSSRLGTDLTREPKDRGVNMTSRRLTYVPTLGHEDTDEEKGKENTSPNPSISGIGRTFIEIGLVYLADRAQSASLDHEQSFHLAYSS